ncbi:MAG TPA: CSS-motif domain-containing protein, partial [Steroidobacteraceae bacterium]|nr:CSS-motif domain-containing protein [Steroidobacteraceae bacterium]
MALLAVAVPVGFAISLAARQAREAEQALVATYAADVLHRGDMATDEMFEAAAALAAAGAADPCSDSNIALMRRFALASNYLQAVGYVADGRLICSSQGRGGAAIALGPVEWVTPAGVRMRTHVRFPFDDRNTYLAAELNGYATILNKSIPLDATTGGSDVSLASFSPPGDRIVVARGFIDPRWVQRSGPQPVTTFVDGRYVVAVAMSRRYH